MSQHLSAITMWLGQTLAVGGGLLLLAALAMAVTRQPVRRRMIGAVAVRIALLVPLLTAAPKWLFIPLPADAEPTRIGLTVSDDAKHDRSTDSGWPGLSLRSPGLSPDRGFEDSAPATPGHAIVLASGPVQHSPAATEPGVAGLAPLNPAADAARFAEAAVPVPFPWRSAVLLGYGVMAGFFAARWLLAQIALAHLLGRSRPAGRALQTLFAEVAGPGPRPELRVVPDVTGPVCCGLWRPVVLLPQRLAEAADEETLRWIFVHELAHLRRGDAWTACWFGLAAAVYCPLPWFWWLRRQVSLCQEYVADAEAATGEMAAEYAAFLVNLSRSAGRGRRLAAASGVLGSPSELYRRITMLLDNRQRVDRRCPRRWSLVATGALLALAVLFSGLGVARHAVAQDEPKPEKKDKPKKLEEKNADKQKADPEEKFVKPNKEGRRFVVPAEGFDAEQFSKQMQKMAEEMQKRFGQRGWVVGDPNHFYGFNTGSGRLGVVVEKPQGALIDALDLPKDQGLVLADVKADSAAAKAGLKANDILLELGGKAVPSDPAEFRKQVMEIKADATVDAIVLRKGKRETIKSIKLPEAKAERNVPFAGEFAFPVPNVEIPNIREFRVPEFPPVPAIGDPFAGQGGNSMSIQIANDQFTVRKKDDAIDISVSGKIEEGKKTINSVKITDGTEKHSYDKLDNVPEKYRDKVDGLLKNIHVNKK